MAPQSQKTVSGAIGLKNYRMSMTGLVKFFSTFNPKSIKPFASPRGRLFFMALLPNVQQYLKTKM
jgi:hypothetical protein